MVHCEDSQIINDNMKACKEKNGEDPDIKFHPLIRSEEACVASTTKAVDLAKEYGTRLHVAHISTERELALFSPEHPNITAEITIRLLFLFRQTFFHETDNILSMKSFYYIDFKNASYR